MRVRGKGGNGGLRGLLWKFITLDGGCAFVYEEPREAQSDIREDAEFTTLSALSIFFPSNEAFLAYELRE